MDTRLLGLDLARFLAIAGMVVAHTVPGDAQGPVAAFLVTGNASTLFAIASGFSVVLASRRYLAVGARGRAQVSLLLRGACLIALGIALGTLPQQAVIVLVYLGLALCLAAPFLTAPGWLLGTVAAALTVLVPPIDFVVRRALGTLSEGYSLSIPDLVDPLRMLRAAFLTGTYPALTWLVYVLAGMLLARVVLRSARSDGQRRWTAAVLACWGAASAAGAVAVSVAAGWIGPPLPDAPAYGSPNTMSWVSLLLDVPHSGTLLDIARGGGVATAAIGLCLLLCWSWPRAAWALRPAMAAGAAPLSSYVLHILTLAVVAVLADPLDETPWWQYGWGAALLNIALILALGGLQAATRRRGPFEIVVSRIANRMPREPDAAGIWQ